MSETNTYLPMYGSWVAGVRPRTNAKPFHLGGQARQPHQHTKRDGNKPSWRDIIDKVFVVGKAGSSTSGACVGVGSARQDNGRFSQGSIDQERVHNNVQQKSVDFMGTGSGTQQQPIPCASTEAPPFDKEQGRTSDISQGTLI